LATDLSSGHAVTLAFYNNEFIICNRGSRIHGTPVIQRFHYDPAKMNLDVLKYLIFNSKILHVNTIQDGEMHQTLQLDIILPKILGANRTKESPFDFSPHFKEQTIANCSKASPMTAIKMGIYLKELAKGTTPREAAWKAKEAGDEVSYHLRRKSIDKAKELITNPSTDPSIKAKLSSAIAKAEAKLIHKTASRLENLKLEDVVGPFTLFAIDPRSMGSTSSHPPREAKATDHPLLLAIARQRKNLGFSWNPTL